MKKLKKLSACLSGFALLGVMMGSAQADLLDDIQARGALKCGIHSGKAGFAIPDANGRWEGLDVDYCRALAAATIGDGEKVEFITVGSKNRFTALSSGEIDVLSRTTTVTATREGRNGVDFTTPLFLDGQGFMVKASLGVKSPKELDGATICVNPGTTSEKNLNDYFEKNGLSYKGLVIEGDEETTKAYIHGRCDAYTNDRSALAARRLALPSPENNVVLDEVISKEPLGPFVRQGEARFRDVATWVGMALFAAEELGITQSNAADIAVTTKSPEIKRLLGTEGTIGEGFGLSNDWALKAIIAVGNYSEMFERYLGPKTPLAMERAQNALWKDGGLIYPYPFR